MPIPTTPKAHFRLYTLYALIACLWLISINANSNINKNRNPTGQFKKLLPVEIDQLQPENGMIPVVLRCEDAELSAPGSLKKLSCVIRNATNKYIVAAAISISINIEEGGRQSTDYGYLAIETFVHPDFHEEHRKNLIPPGGERNVQDLPTDYENAQIKRITVRIDFVEFSDHAATLGPNRAGARIISNIRKGAAKYKEWLVQQYNKNGKSLDAIASLLEKSQSISNEVCIENGDEEQGAIFYRNFARKSYHANGAKSLNKYLEKNSIQNK